MRELEERFPGFHYLPTFSREVPSNLDHLVRIGYVHTVYEEICRAKMSEVQSNELVMKPNFYLCGWKNMIDEAKRRIQELGYDRKSIHQELYG